MQQHLMRRRCVDQATAEHAAARAGVPLDVAQDAARLAHLQQTGQWWLRRPIKEWDDHTVVFARGGIERIGIEQVREYPNMGICKQARNEIESARQSVARYGPLRFGPVDVAALLPSYLGVHGG